MGTIAVSRETHGQGACAIGPPEDGAGPRDSRIFVRVAARAGGSRSADESSRGLPIWKPFTPPSLAQILPTVVPGLARGLRISVRPRTPLRRGAEGARRASGKLHGKDEVARSDPLPLATCERQRLPGAGSVPDCQRRVVQPHGGDQAGGVGRLAAGCGIRTAEVGPVCWRAGRVRRIRTAEVGGGPPPRHVDSCAEGAPRRE